MTTKKDIERILIRIYNVKSEIGLIENRLNEMLEET